MGVFRRFLARHCGIICHGQSLQFRLQVLAMMRPTAKVNQKGRKKKRYAFGCVAFGCQGVVMMPIKVKDFRE